MERVTLPPRDKRHAQAALFFFIRGLLASPVVEECDRGAPQTLERREC